MKNIRIFLSENFHLLVVKFSVHLNRHVFVMRNIIFPKRPYVAIYSLVKSYPMMHYSVMSLLLLFNFTLKFKFYLNPHNFIPDC